MIDDETLTMRQRLEEAQALCRHVYSVLTELVTVEEDGRHFVEDQPVPEIQELLALLREAIGEGT